MTAEELLALVIEYGKLTRRVMVQPTPENLAAGDDAFGAIASAVYSLGLPVDNWCGACAGEGGPHKSWCAGGFEEIPEPTRAHRPSAASMGHPDQRQTPEPCTCGVAFGTAEGPCVCEPSGS